MIKRLFDLVLSAAGLLVSSPLWLVIAAAIKLEDGGPVFFPQDRVGRGGEVFPALKFRSMVPNAEARTGPVQAAHNDPRVTRVGRLLRATAMDELPQLWNIFVGDMSFVGPRPLRPGETEVRGDGRMVRLDQIRGYRERHLIQPGLTGLTQVYAPRDISRASKFRLDRLYLRRAGFWLDLKLIALSFWITGRGKWEARERKVFRWKRVFRGFASSRVLGFAGSWFHVRSPHSSVFQQPENWRARELANRRTANRRTGEPANRRTRERRAPSRERERAN